MWKWRCMRYPHIWFEYEKEVTARDSLAIHKFVARELEGCPHEHEICSGDSTKAPNDP